MSSEPAPVPPAPARRAAPGGGARRLNPAQLGVWYAQRMDPGNPVFTMGGYLEIHGPVDPQLLRAAVTALIDEDETARLRFTEADGVPAQHFGPAPQTEPGAPLVELVDLTGGPDPSGEAARRMRQDMDTARDPLRDRLFGHLLFKLGPEHYLWYNREHHLIHDGYTSTLIRRRAAQLYTALATGTEAGPPLGSFARLLDEQAAYPQSAAYRRDGEYWRRIMADAAPPSGPASAGNPSHRVARRVDLVDDAVFAGLRRFAERTNVTWQQAFVAATVVHRYLWTGDPDVVLSLPMPGRLGPTSGAPGMAANMLPLRYRVEPGQTAETLAAEVAAQMLRAQWHQRYPAEELLRDLGWPTRAGRLFGPVVNIVAGDEQSDFAGMPAVHHLLSTGGTAEELSLTVSRTPSGSLRVDYTIDEAFAESADLTAYQRTFARVLAALAERADTAVGELELLDAAERELALCRWNDTAVDIRPLLLADEDGTEAGDGERPRSLESLGALVERQARRTPDATALIYEHERLEYAELNARANRLARRLRASGAGRGAIVGVLLERGLDFAVALLAVAKTGAAYAVLDPDFPDERLHTVIGDAAIGVAVTRARLADRLRGVACLVLVDEHAEQINALSGDDLGVEVSALDPACVMFTSGSTGRPKGVLSPHRALIATLTAQHYATFGPGEVFLQCSPVSWDAFSLEFWGALLHGGTCVLQPGQRPEPTHIARLTAQHAVTMLQLSSGLFNVLVDEYPHAFTGVRLAFTGGEPASGTHTAKIQHHHPHLTIANGYGPAESMGFTTVF
ncbi:AMP-binding protein, partial [Actinocrinis sp.]|uniref:AMP-binding protein n=1 Tax=Actinocrinis sp. TaxID=1920516 RepID=UPI002D35D5F6